MSLPACSVCGTRRVAMRGVAYCFECWPGGPVVPPPCLKCGSRSNYFANGVCTQCHYLAKARVDSCRDCLAWGATRQRKWRCAACEQRAARYPRGICGACHHEGTIDGRGYCRLCRRQRTHVTVDNRWGTVEDAVKYGHQLFIADLFFRSGEHVANPYELRHPPVPFVPMTPVEHQQLTLFDWPRQVAHGMQFGADPPDERLVAYLHHFVEDRAAHYGWDDGYAGEIDRGTRILLALQDTPGAVIKASELFWTTELGISRSALAEVLTLARFYEEDREPPITRWFNAQTADLPAGIREELAVWLDVMVHGSDRLPRRLPRSPKTAQWQLRYALPVIRQWAHRMDSLREVSSEDVRQALPPTGSRRTMMLGAMRSIFGILKARKLVFINPTSRLHAKKPNDPPLPTIDLDQLRAALDSDNPACAALAALLAYHALRAHELCSLRLTDIRDGRLYLARQVIPLAEPVRERIAAYLDYRATRWPRTTNQHLFLSYKSAVHGGPVNHKFLSLQLGMAPLNIRQDRILEEAIASNGDLRRIIDLFGLSPGGGVRYTHSAEAVAARVPQP